MLIQSIIWVVDVLHQLVYPAIRFCDVGPSLDHLIQIYPDCFSQQFLCSISIFILGRLIFEDLKINPISD